jgi:hypothetical protein
MAPATKATAAINNKKSQSDIIWVY